MRAVLPNDEYMLAVSKQAEFLGGRDELSKRANIPFVENVFYVFANFRYRDERNNVHGQLGGAYLLSKL
jgi:hypothetical protein